MKRLAFALSLLLHTGGAVGAPNILVEYGDRADWGCWPPLSEMQAYAEFKAEELGIEDNMLILLGSWDESSRDSLCYNEVVVYTNTETDGSAFRSLVGYMKRYAAMKR